MPPATSTRPPTEMPMIRPKLTLLDDDGTGTGSANGNSGSSFIGSITDGVSSVGSGISAFIDPHTWYRVGQVVLGIVFVIGGLMAFFRNDISAGAGIAAKVAPLVAL